MKRKILIFAIVAILAFSSIAFVACSGNGNKLSYGKKYIYEDCIDSDSTERYFIFYKNGTGIFYVHRIDEEGNYNYATGKWEDAIVGYTISFKYTIDSDNEVVYCFYDSFKYHSDHNDTYAGYDDPTWSIVLNFNKDFVMTMNGSFYFTESFLNGTIPNYGKEKDKD